MCDKPERPHRINEEIIHAKPLRREFYTSRRVISPLKATFYGLNNVLFNEQHPYFYAAPNCQIYLPMVPDLTRGLYLVLIKQRFPNLGSAPQNGSPTALYWAANWQNRIPNSPDHVSSFC